MHSPEKKNLPRHEKKRQRCERLESELVQLLSGDAAQGTVERLAEEVRQAKVQTMRSRRAKLHPLQAYAAEAIAIDRRIEEWEGLGLEALLDRYRRPAGGT